VRAKGEGFDFNVLSSAAFTILFRAAGIVFSSSFKSNGTISSK
jgi:hypothetical protein